MRVLSARAALLGTVAAAAFITTPAFAQSAQQTTQEAQQQPAEQAATTAPDPEGQDTSTGESSSPRGAPKSDCSASRLPCPRSTSAHSTASRRRTRPASRAQSRTSTSCRAADRPTRPISTSAASASLTRCRPLTRRSASTSTTSISPASAAPRSTCSTSSGSKCCADRRARSTARTPSAARSRSSRASRARISALTLRSASAPTISSTQGHGIGPAYRRRSSAGISFLRATRDGFVRDEVLDRRYNDKDTVGVRGALAFTPSDTVRVDLTRRLQQGRCRAERRSPAQRSGERLQLRDAVTEQGRHGPIRLHGRGLRRACRTRRSSSTMASRERSPTI